MRNENRFFTLRRCAGFLAMAIGALVFAASCEVEARRLPTFTIDFCLNGGEGITPVAHTVGIGSAVVIPGHYGIHKSGNIFTGWGTAADGNGTRVAAGAEIVPTGDTTLYAQWLPMVVNDDLIRIPGGTFQMGSLAGTPNSTDWERPVRAVTISAFYMRRFPVTQGEWVNVMGTNPSQFHAGHSAIIAAGANWRNLPVERVSWYDALVFSNRLSIARGLTPAYSIGGSTNPDNWGPVPTSSNATWNAVTIVAGSTGYRLPTEAQWEFAARGGNGSPGNFTFSGSNNAAEVAWHNANSGSRTHEVGRLRPNALGLYDMSGNVWEWVWDRLGAYPNTAQTNPAGPAAGDNRVLRGGSWDDAPAIVRSAHRSFTPPVLWFSFLGFRLVRP